MLRFYFLIFTSIPLVIYYILLGRSIANHIEKYTEEQRYKYALDLMHLIQKKGRIKTKAFGVENLPKEGGYVMFPNHQGKYDTLGIITTHEKPCTIMIDKSRSYLPLADEVTDVLQGCRLDKTNMRAQVESIIQVTKELISGRRYIIFPEGGYDHNGNNLQEFLPGSFKCAMKAKCPIVPVALIDSYLPFGTNSLKPVNTQVHYLKPLYYEDYKEMTSKEISDYVKQVIGETIAANVRVS